MLLRQTRFTLSVLLCQNMGEGQDFNYGFKGLPDQSYMQYVLMIYAGTFIVVILVVGWKLRGK